MQFTISPIVHIDDMQMIEKEGITKQNDKVNGQIFINIRVFVRFYANLTISAINIKLLHHLSQLR